MRKTKGLMFLIVLLFVFSFFTGCELFEPFFGGLFNGSPTVELSYSASDPGLYPVAGETITITATASDPDDDELSYTWYLDDVQDTATTSTVTLTSYYTGDYTLRVVVSDGNDTADAEITVPVVGTGTLCVVNYSSYPVYYLYLQREDGTEWSADLLGSYYIGTNQYVYIYSVPAGTYNMKAVSSSTYSVSWTSTSSYTIPEGSTFTWSLYN